MFLYSFDTDKAASKKARPFPIFYSFDNYKKKLDHFTNCLKYNFVNDKSESKKARPFLIFKYSFDTDRKDTSKKLDRSFIF